MDILMIAINDPAGTAIAFTKAINRYTHHTCRLITKEIRYNFMFEKDLHLPWLSNEDWGEVEELLKKSDIFHFHMTADEDLELGPFKITNYIEGKQIVHHHHGHPDFRSHPDKYRAKYKALKRRNLLVSTPDLLEYLPEARWVPNLVPLNDQLYMPQEITTNGKVIIGQSPTRQDLKNTSDLRDVVNNLVQSETEFELELDIITNTNHMECLKRKRNCHIIFDHMQGYFGVSSLESLSHGKPVVAGLDEWNQKCIQEFTGAEKLPWVVARNLDELESCFYKLIGDAELRNDTGSKGRTFMEKCWTENLVLGLLLEFYGGL